MSIVVSDYKNICQLLEEEERIIVFGAGTFGKKLLAEIEQICGNLDKVVAIVDNEASKQGDLINGLEICAVDKIRNIYKKCIIIIAMKAYESVLRQVDNMPQFNGWKCCVYHIMNEGWCYSTVEELKYHKRINEKVITQYAMNIQHMNEREKVQLLDHKRQELRAGKHIIAKMVFIATNRCTLKCEGCLGRVPYFNDPKDIDINIILRDIDLFLQCIDECIAIEIAGGEPLLYPHLDVLLDYLIKSEKVLGVRLTTNGTVVPNETTLGYMAHEKVKVGISDYGMLDRLAQVVYSFEKHGVNFVFHSNMTWTDPGDLSKRNRSKEELKEQFENCWDAFNCKTIVNGRLFACARYARLYMQDIHNFEKDSIFLLEYENLEERRNAIFDLYMVDYANSCDYCNFGTKDCKTIPAGLQMSTSFYRSAYTLVKRKVDA